MNEQDTIKLENNLDPNKEHVGKKEIRGFCIGLAGQNLVYGLVSAYLMYFCTNVLKMEAFYSGLIVGVSRVWDGFNDPIMGSFIDRHRFKNGEKLRPFLKLTPIPVAILTLLLFIDFGISSQLLLCLTVLFIYLAWDVFYTLQDVPLWGMTAMMTPNPHERGKIVQWARLSGSVTGGIMSGLIFFVLDFTRAWGLSDKWTFLIAAVLFGLGGGILSITAHRAKERVPVVNQQKNMGESIKLLFKNKMLLILCLANLLGSVGVGVYLNAYFFENMIVSDISFLGSFGIMTIFTACAYLPAVLIMFFANKLSVKVGGMLNLLIISQICNVVGRIICFFIGYEGINLYITMGVLAVFIMPGGVIPIANTALWGDSADLLEWKTGKRTEGVTFAMQTFLAKVTSGITMVLVGAVLTILDFSSEKIGQQGPVFNKWIWPIYMLTPVIGSILYIIPLFFIKYPKKLQALVKSDLKQRREGLPESGESPYIKSLTNT